jgi:hypothetical protein
MRALKQARKRIENQPAHPSSVTLSALVVALESETPFNIADLYKLDYDEFELALAVLAEWRLDRYYSSKVRLLDLSVQVSEMQPSATASTSTSAPASGKD